MRKDYIVIIFTFMRSISKMILHAIFVKNNDSAYYKFIKFHKDRFDRRFLNAKCSEILLNNRKTCV